MHDFSSLWFIEYSRKAASYVLRPSARSMVAKRMTSCLSGLLSLVHYKEVVYVCKTILMAFEYHSLFVIANLVSSSVSTQLLVSEQ